MTVEELIKKFANDNMLGYQVDDNEECETIEFTCDDKHKVIALYGKYKVVEFDFWESNLYIEVSK